MKNERKEEMKRKTTYNISDITYSEIFTSREREGEKIYPRLSIFGSGRREVILKKIRKF